MSTAFKERPLSPQSFVQRLLRQHPVENAIIELNNLLATRSILSITSDDLTDIEQRYGFSLSQYGLNLEEFYAVQLNYRFIDRCLPTDGLPDLTHLRTLFRLPTQSVDMLHAQIGEVIYRRWVEKTVRNGKVSDEEKAILTELRQLLSLPADLADNMYKDVCQALLDQFVEECSAGARITPEEETWLLALSTNLGVRPSISTKRTIDRFKRYWQVENTDLPVIDIPIACQKLEHGHYAASEVRWCEERATARRTKYDDHYDHHKSFDVVDLRSNRPSSSKDTFDILKRIDTGNLYLTNKRLIFEGQQKTTSIKLNTVVRVKAYKQGVLIDKLTGKSMLLLFSQDSDMLALLCERVIHSTPA